MENPNQPVSRYSDADLAEFKENIDKKLAVAYEELEYLKEQINDTTENMEKDSDYMEDSTSYSDLEMFQNMLHRQQKHTQNLENALLRIKNKSYGICTATGKLIDKRRLLIVPTTTMSIDAKMAGGSAPEKKEIRPSSSNSVEAVPKFVSRTPDQQVATKKKPMDDDMDLFGDADEDVDSMDMNFDMDHGGDVDMDEMDD